MRNKTHNGRRTFLKSAALAGGAATLALTAEAVLAEASSGPSPDGPGKPSRGYHVTPHVEEYYRLARD